MRKELIEFVLGLVLGVGFAYILVDGIFSEDELHKQIARKAQCKAIDEMLMTSQRPEERLKVLEKHEKILAKCEEVQR